MAESLTLIVPIGCLQLWIAARLTGIVLFNTLISLIGQATITGFLYNIVFTYVLPSGQHKKVASLKRDIVKNRLELKNTSAQDEFSKWAKMRRTVDKQVAELEALSERPQYTNSNATQLRV